MGVDKDQLPAYFLLPAGDNGNRGRRVARLGLFAAAYYRYAAGSVCVPGVLGICHISAQSLYGKPYDILSGFVGVGVFGQRHDAVYNLPAYAYPGKPSSVRRSENKKIQMNFCCKYADKQ